MVTYNLGIPDGPNNPSADQPKMRTNTNAVDEIINVDHVTFNTANGGQHKQVTFNNKNAGVAQIDPQSVLYTASGVASTVSQLLYRTQNAILPISAMRAFGKFTAAALPPAFDTSFNCTLAGSGNTYTITLATNVVTGNEPLIIVFTNSSGTVTYTFTDPILTLLLSAAASNSKISFIVMQF